MIYILSWSEFLGGSESGIHVLPLCHIRVERTKPGGNPISGDIFLAQIGSVIYHPDQNFEGVLTVWSEFWNSACGIRYGHICVAATLWSHMMKKCDLHQLGWFIYHSDQIFKGILNLATNIWNSICGSCYGYIYPTVTFLQNVTSTD